MRGLMANALKAKGVSPAGANGPIRASPDLVLSQRASQHSIEKSIISVATTQGAESMISPSQEALRQRKAKRDILAQKAQQRREEWLDVTRQNKAFVQSKCLSARA